MASKRTVVPVSRVVPDDLATPRKARMSSPGGSRQAPTAPEVRDEMVCDRCERRHDVVWFAPSDVWNQVMRDGDRGNPDRYSFCCPICFIQLAEEAGVCYGRQCQRAWASPKPERHRREGLTVDPVVPLVSPESRKR